MASHDSVKGTDKVNGSQMETFAPRATVGEQSGENREILGHSVAGQECSLTTIEDWCTLQTRGENAMQVPSDYRAYG